MATWRVFLRVLRGFSSRTLRLKAFAIFVSVQEQKHLTAKTAKSAKKGVFHCGSYGRAEAG
jgi:hypothetical protein